MVEINIRPLESALIKKRNVSLNLMQKIKRKTGKLKEDQVIAITPKIVDCHAKESCRREAT